MLIQQFSGIIFPKKPRPVPMDQESDRDQTVPATTTPVRPIPASAGREGAPAPHRDDLQFPVTMERMHGWLQFLGSHPTQFMTPAALEDELTVLGHDLLF